MLYHAQERKIVIHQQPTDCVVFGSGARPLVMIQGLSTRGLRGTADSLAWMYRLFARDYRVYLFERRPRAADGLTVRMLAEDTAAAMDALGIRQADVIGVSQGGMIAQHLAIDRPDLVRRLVLAVTLSRTNDTVRAAIGRWIALTEQGDMKQLVADMAQRMYTPAYLKRYRPFTPLLTALQKPRDTQRFIILARSCLTCSAYDELSAIRCPVFVIGGRQDRVVGAHAGEELARRLGCRSFIYEQYGHAAYEEAADFNRRIYDFLME